MAHSDPINSTQFAVLEWAADESPDGVIPSGGTHKTSAEALQRRRLLQMTTRAGMWSATTAEAGRHYLEQGTVSRYRYAVWDHVSGAVCPLLPGEAALPAASRCQVGRQEV